MLLRAIPLHEPAIEICDQIRRSPVQLRGHRGHERGHESREYYSPQRVRHVLRDYSHIRGLRVRKAGIQNNHRECRENPRPRTHRVVRDVEPQHRKQTVAFVARAENPLRDVAAATGLGSRIPKRPPLHSEINREGDYRKRPHRLESERAGKIGEERGGVRSGRPCCRLHRREFRKHEVHPANCVDCIPGDGDDNRHLEHELKKVGPQHAPKPAQRHVKSGERNQKEDANPQGGCFADP